MLVDCKCYRNLGTVGFVSKDLLLYRGFVG